MEGIHDTVINVTSDIPAFPSFRCFVTDVYGRDGTEDVVIAFKEGKNIIIQIDILKNQAQDICIF